MAKLPLTPSRNADRTVAVLDIGSSKVAALIARIAPDGAATVIGTGQKQCAGLSHGLVTSFERTEAAVRGAMDQAERAAGVQVEFVHASIGAGNLQSDVASTEIDIAGDSITSADMDTLRLAGRSAIQPGSRTVVHAQPALYMLDGTAAVESPVGFHADRLGMDIHVVTAETPPLKNLDRAIKNAHLGLRSLVASPLAASLATLDREERQLGVALVEIGAGVTTVAVHSRGMLVGVASIPMGASDITADIASTFAIRLSDAERIKVLEAAAISTSRDASDLIDLPPIDEDAVGEAAQVPRAQLIAVVRQRLDMIFAAVETRLGALGFNGPRARQVVLTGGGAELRGMADYAQGVLGRNVRIGRPTGLAGLPQAQSSPAFSTLAGLVLFAAADEPDIWHSAAVGPARQKTGFMAAFDRLIRGF